MSTAPDDLAQRLGGIGWTRRTRGSLTGAERRRLTGEITRAQAANDRRPGQARARAPAGGRRRSRPRGLPPAGQRARARRPRRPAASSRRPSPATATAPTCSAARWPRSTASRSTASSSTSRALLHDAGIEQPVAGEDFTLRSAQRAIDCAHAGGLAEHQAELIADAITVHATPGHHARARRRARLLRAVRARPPTSPASASGTCRSRSSRARSSCTRATASRRAFRS